MLVKVMVDCINVVIYISLKSSKMFDRKNFAASKLFVDDLDCAK